MLGYTREDLDAGRLRCPVVEKQVRQTHVGAAILRRQPDQRLQCLRLAGCVSEAVFERFEPLPRRYRFTGKSFGPPGIGCGAGAISLTQTDIAQRQPCKHESRFDPRGFFEDLSSLVDLLLLYQHQAEPVSEVPVARGFRRQSSQGRLGFRQAPLRRHAESSLHRYVLCEQAAGKNK